MMVNEMSTHASIYIPLSIPQRRPQYLHFDRNSQWHTSALLSTALESMTLPTRLRHGTQKRAFVDDLEAVLNVNGNQRIAQLQFSMFDSEKPPRAFAVTPASTDERAPPENNGILVREDGLQLARPRLDMNCYNAGSTSPFTAPHIPSDHVFGAVETTRTKIEAATAEAMSEDEITSARYRRRFAGLPVVERFLISRIPSLRN